MKPVLQTDWGQGKKTRSGSCAPLARDTRTAIQPGLDTSCFLVIVKNKNRYLSSQTCPARPSVRSLDCALGRLQTGKRPPTPSPADSDPALEPTGVGRPTLLGRPVHQEQQDFRIAALTEPVGIRPVCIDLNIRRLCQGIALPGRQPNVASTSGHALARAASLPRTGKAA